MSHNRILVQNLAKIFDIYATEMFVEAIIAYFSSYFHVKKTISKLQVLLKEIDNKRYILVPLDYLIKAFVKFYGDEFSYIIHLNMILKPYLQKKHEMERPDLEIDVN